MELADSNSHGFLFTLTLCVALAVPGLAQQPSQSQVPRSFTFDLETAARLRPGLMAESVPPTGRYATGRVVFERLIEQVASPADPRFRWELRILDDDQLNAYSSPDGSVYVESGLGALAGESAGLWAAILSHEIAHVVRRDWARRYLYEKSRETASAASIVLGDPGMPSASWSDSQKASEELGRFCRRLEIDADYDSLMLMARAGYHPDFVPALHHLLHAHGSFAGATSLYAMHPCWEERDRELLEAYVAADIEFEHRWPGWYASPGGNPPIVVFAEGPKLRKTGGKAWEIQVPMRCKNLAGAIEVVLRVEPNPGKAKGTKTPRSQSDSELEMRQVTGCTSPRTTITFNLADAMDAVQAKKNSADIYILDAWGGVLARTDMTKWPR